MGEKLENWGMGMAGQAVGGIMGMMLGRANEKHQDKRARQQARAMQELQMEGQKAMTDYNQLKQMEMWEATGYVGQKRQMKEAGLNPGLMYGMGGGGGQTAAIAAGNVGSGSAPSYGGESQGMAAMGLQMGMQAAQIEVMKSQAKLNNVEADKKAGVDTDLTKMQTASLSQGITNQVTVNELNKVEQRIKEVTADIAEDTQWEAEAKIVNESRTAKETLVRAVRENWIDESTKNEKVLALQQMGVQAIADVALTKAQRSGIMQNIEQSKAQVQKWATEITQKWREIAQGGRAISNQERNTFIQESLRDIDRNFKEALIEQGQWHNFINGTGQVLQMGTKIPVGTKPAPITGFGGGNR